MFDVLFWNNEVRSFNCDLRADSRTCVDIMSTVSVNLRRRQSIFTDLRYHFHKSIKIVRIRSVTPISYTQVKMTEFSIPLSLCFPPSLTPQGKRCVAGARLSAEHFISTKSKLNRVFISLWAFWTLCYLLWFKCYPQIDNELLPPTWDMRASVDLFPSVRRVRFFGNSTWKLEQTFLKTSLNLFSYVRIFSVD